MKALKLLGNSQGQSLIEVVLSLVVISIFLVALVNMSVQSARRLQFSKNQLKAKAYLEDDLEQARYLRDNSGWSVFLASCSTSRTEDELPAYTIVRSCTNPAYGSADIAAVETTVSWGDSSGDHSIDAMVALGNQQEW